MTRYSIIIPVLNEAEGINAVLDHLQTLESHETCECIVVDGSPDGDTLQAIRRRDVLCLKAPPGRARQMNAGAAQARGEVLIFLHADTQLPKNALHLIDWALAGGPFVGGAFDLRIDSERLAYRIISRIASWRSRLTRIPYGDQAFFVRKDCFTGIGSYPEIPLMEDVSLMQKIKKTGGRIRFVSTPVVTSARRWEQEGIVYATLRNWLLVSAYYLGVSPHRLSKYYHNKRNI